MKIGAILCENLKPPDLDSVLKINTRRVMVYIPIGGKFFEAGRQNLNLNILSRFMDCGGKTPTFGLSPSPNISTIPSDNKCNFQRLDPPIAAMKNPNLACIFGIFKARCLKTTTSPSNFVFKATRASKMDSECVSATRQS